MMLAISISRGQNPIAKLVQAKNLEVFRSLKRQLSSATFRVLLATALTFIFSLAAIAHSTSNQIDFAARAKREFMAARARFQTETNNPEAAWQFARACFDLGEFATRNADRAEIAETGIDVARQLLVGHPDLAEAHYYLGMNMGQLARTKTLGALRLVTQMETEFEAARRLNERLDHAGPDRNLGLLYLEAPSFGSIGNRSKARVHLRRAVAIFPEYPENRLYLIEAYLRWGEQVAAAREFKLLAEQWAELHKKYSGENWELSWQDWEKRFASAKAKIKDQSTQIESPRQKD